MKATVALLVLFAAACFATVVDKEFLGWMDKYGKVYANVEDSSYRYNVWLGNKAFVEAWNAEGHTSTVELNKFADMTIEEFRNYYNGVVIKGPHDNKNTEVLPQVELPATVNWVTAGAVTGVKNQGQCGSCWSFSTTGSVEGAHFLATKSLVGLSEANLVDCSSDFGNQGCNGGLMDDAFQYIMQCGIDTESSYPYVPETESCQYNAANIGAKITGYKDVTTGSEPALQTAVATIGPVSVAIDASHSSFQLYSGGVYYEPACSTTQLDHGVLAAGYGTSGSSDYWLVKNSWGADWGLQGYIWMSRNRQNNCGIATMSSYPTGASTRTVGDEATASCKPTTTSTSSSTSSSSTSGSGSAIISEAL